MSTPNLKIESGGGCNNYNDMITIVMVIVVEAVKKLV